MCRKPFTQVIAALALVAGLSALAQEVNYPISDAVNKALRLQWSTTNVQFLHGYGYEDLQRFEEDFDMNIITIEHANGWKYGESYGFLDISDFDETSDDSNTQYYFEIYEYLKIIELSSNKLLVLLNDILDFSKIETGKLELVKKEFSLRKSLESVINLFSPQCNSKNIDLISNF